VKTTKVDTVLTSRRNPVCKAVMRRRSGTGKFSQCVAAAKREQKHLKVNSRPLRKAANKTQRATVGESETPNDDSLCEDSPLMAKEFVIPLAERVKLRRMSSSVTLGGRVGCRKSANATVAVKMTHKAVRLLSAGEHLHKQTRKGTKRGSSYVDRGGNPSSVLNKTGKKSFVEKTLTAARQRNNVTRRHLSSSDSAVDFKTSGNGSAGSGKRRMPESRRPEMTSAKSTTASSYNENVKQKISSSSRKVRRPLDHRRGRRRQSGSTEKIESARLRLAEELEGKRSLATADGELDDEESENMPMLSVATSDADINPALDGDETETMPFLEPLSTNGSSSDICMPQFATRVKRAPADDDSCIEELKPVKREPASSEDRDIDVSVGKELTRPEMEQSQQSTTKCSPRRKSRARKKCPASVELPSTPGDLTQSDNVSDIINRGKSVDSLQTKANPGTYFVAPARACAPVGVEQLAHSGVPVAPLVVGWYPMIGPNAFRPPQLLPAAGSVAVLPPPGGFGVMLPPRSVASSPPVLSSRCDTSGSAELGAAVRQVFWPSPFIRPFMPQTCGSLLAPNLVQPMIAITGNRPSLRLDAAGPCLTPGGINCSPVYPTQLLNLQPSTRSSFFSSTNL
jgi:hypothetical protein